MPAASLEDVQRVVGELRHLRGHKLLSGDWQHVVEAEDMLLDLAAAIDRQAVELELPDAEGLWFTDDESLDGFVWTLVEVYRLGESTDSPLLWRMPNEEPFEPMECERGRWVRCKKPDGKGA